jgi:hypothetical protein
MIASAYNYVEQKRQPAHTLFDPVIVPLSSRPHRVSPYISRLTIGIGGGAVVRSSWAMEPRWAAAS